MNGLLQDLHFAVRALLRRPGFALLAILLLGLGAGVTTVIFTVVSGVLLKPLSYGDPERLVTVHLQSEKYAERWGFSYPDFLDCHSQCRSFEAVAAWAYSGGTVSAPGEAEYVVGRRVSAELFSVLRLPMAKGRAFLTAEDRVGAAPVAIISTRLWQGRLGADPAVIGKTIAYDGAVCTVVGVAPAGFELDGDVDVLTPLGQNDEPRMRNRSARFLRVVARLGRGVSLSQAQSELAVLSERLAKQYADSNAGITEVPRALQSEFVGGVRPTLWLLLGAVSVILLMACVNIASLLLTRVVARRHEFALRLALGASGRRLLRQCLTESGVLGLLGGSLGLLLAAFGTHPFLHLWPDRLPRADEVQVDGRVLTFALASAVLTSLIFGLLPALEAKRRAIEQTLRSRSRSIAGSARRPLTSFVISEIALALVLLSAAGLLGRTVLRLASLHPGIDVRNLLTARVALSPADLSSPEKGRAAWQRLAEKMRQVPGFESVALTDIVPLREGENVLGYWATASPPPPNQEAEALASAVTPDYLHVMRLPLLRGRFFDQNDRIGSVPVVVIDENLARHAFAGADPVGKLLWIPAMGSQPVQVVGVVGHVRHWGLAADELSSVQDQCYYPLAQVPDRLVRLFSSVLSIVVRTSVPPLNMVEALERQARVTSGGQSLYEVRTMEQLASASLGRQRFLLLLFAIFSAFALLLACVGIYGVISYLTSQRVPEFGVRVALGANSLDILRLVLGESLGTIVAGVAMGLLGSLVTGRILERLAPNVRTLEGSIFAVVASALTVLALLASYLPARKAANVDPMVALRYE